MPRKMTFYQTEAINIEVVLPEDCVGSFIKQFGHTFSHSDPLEGIILAKASSVFCRGEDISMQVSVPIAHKNKLSEFLSAFCDEYNLALEAYQ